jgi:hypothetical protein
MVMDSKRTMLGDWPTRRGKTICKKCSAALRETLMGPPKILKLA